MSPTLQGLALDLAGGCLSPCAWCPLPAVYLMPVGSAYTYHGRRTRPHGHVLGCGNAACRARKERLPYHGAESERLRPLSEESRHLQAGADAKAAGRHADAAWHFGQTRFWFVARGVSRIRQAYARRSEGLFGRVRR
jgi:hypothetical protein